MFCFDNGKRGWAKKVLNYSGQAQLLSEYPHYMVSIKLKIVNMLFQKKYLFLIIFELQIV